LDDLETEKSVTRPLPNPPEGVFSKGGATFQRQRRRLLEEGSRRAVDRGGFVGGGNTAKKSLEGFKGKTLGEKKINDYANYADL